MAPSRRWLIPLVLANLVASLLHGGHNVLFFDQYPQPPSPHYRQ